MTRRATSTKDSDSTHTRPSRIAKDKDRARSVGFLVLASGFASALGLIWWMTRDDRPVGKMGIPTTSRAQSKEGLYETGKAH
jgi:hypothetical protein